MDTSGKPLVREWNLRVVRQPVQMRCCRARYEHTVDAIRDTCGGDRGRCRCWRVRCLRCHHLVPIRACSPR
jgi:hypothetical protein